MNEKDFIVTAIEKNKNTFCELSDKIWEYAETWFQEFKSAELLCNALEKEGFNIERGIAGIPTAFVATYGSGAPAVAFLGEYDALSGMSQKSMSSKQEPLLQNGNGHGCGHNLLGVGSLAAAIAVKDYIKEKNILGTVKYFGCPAEESGSGKTFMVREGAFKDIDVAFTWHPSTHNSVVSVNFLASLQYRFKFHGKSSHAAASPFLGRSALDAVELMNVGSNYLREHMHRDTMLHYAITNTGGISPNVVQAEAEVLYYIRAPKVSQAIELAERVCNVAKGAAMMTGTECEICIEDGLSNLVPNRVLEEVLYESFKQIGINQFDKEELKFAQEIRETLSKQHIIHDLMGFKAIMGDSNKEISEYCQAIENKLVSDLLVPYAPSSVTIPGSTDVGDVSYVVPTAQIITACSAIGTPEHSWQLVSQGKSSIAHKGMLTAGKVLAAAAINVLLNPKIAEKAKTELKLKLEGEPYICPLPNDYKPPVNLK